MSVQKAHTTVYNYALILLVLSHVPVTLDTDLPQIVTLAMVNITPTSMNQIDFLCECVRY